MPRENCWEAKSCGRERGGVNAEVLGICPAAAPGEFNGVNGGTHRGRFCWAIAGTLCGGVVQGTNARKMMNCLKCEFLVRVSDEEARRFLLMPSQQDRDTVEPSAQK